MKRKQKQNPVVAKTMRRSAVVVVMFSTVLLLLQTWTANALIITKPAVTRQKQGIGWTRHLATNNDKNDNKESEEQNFYEDFGGQIIGGGNGKGRSSFPSNTQLQERIRVLQQDEFVKEAQIKRNWKIGNWKVRGFSLDPDPPTSSVVKKEDGFSLNEDSRIVGDDDRINPQTTTPPLRQKIQVSRLYWDKSSLASARPRILVGRTDGSLFLVQLGTEYLTKLSTTTSSNMDDFGFSFAPVEALQQQQQQQNQQDDDFLDDEEDDENELIVGGDDNNNKIPIPSVPFTICHHFQAAASEICAILSLEDEPFIFTAAKGEGTITQWQLMEEDVEEDDEDEEEEKGGVTGLPYRTFQGTHDGSDILYLNAISSRRSTKQDDDNDEDSPDVLISVSMDGVVALWNLQDGKQLLKFQAKIPDDANMQEYDNATSNGHQAVASAAVDVPSGVLFLGMVSGHVLAFAVREMLSAVKDLTEVGGEVPPNGRFLAQEKGAVTSMTCAGSGSLVRQKRGQSASLVLLTGGVDGTVKQWEILPVKTEAGTKLEHWPRLANQRLSKRAHLFKGGHESSVRVIVANDSTKFLSASGDGSVVAWSATKGKELFRMDGFSDKISSLLLLDYLLITDGMEDYVCVHDFEVDGSEVEEGYEFEW